MDMKLGPWKNGMDNVSPEATRDGETLVDAVNVVLDREGGAARRAGYTVLNPTASHSLWCSPTGRAYCVMGGWLCRVRFTAAMEVTQLYELHVDVVLSYAELDGSVICGNPSELLRIDPDDVVTTLGLPKPDAPGVAAVAYGGLYAGRYAVAIAAMRGYEEGPLSASSFVDVPEGGGIAVTGPVGGGSYRIYRTAQNGGVLQSAGIVLGGASATVGFGPMGRQADTQNLDRMPGGSIVRAWRGLVLVARGRMIFWSEPLRYGLHDPRHSFAQFEHKVTLLEPVDGGVFVGDASGVRFYAGKSPAEWTVKTTGGMAPVEGTGSSMPGSMLGGDLAGDARVAVWLAENGFVVGTADGRLAEVQTKRIRLPDSQAAGSGCMVVRDGQIIAALN